MRNSKDEINAILENFIIYACGSNDKERDILEATLDDYQEVMSDEGCGLEDCPFLNEEDEDEEPIDEVSCKVIVGNITQENQVQLNLFDQIRNREKYTKISKVIDRINSSMGRDKLRIATQGFDRKWKMKQEQLSQCYTTRIDEILTVKV